ncbi:expressed unknown protein [Seminavis robusta]|uniref:Uncharacterized protein n=1 Tax=Seminavis robusta TaxID=568900 RepID=A0A9N8HCD0_9STRA|nr:expressed unknown protein [Seminavis robusta]|eukprot:Sro297_g110830.1 n/a (301) ;mRNA; f:6230-7233
MATGAGSNGAGARDNGGRRKVLHLTRDAVVDRASRNWVEEIRPIKHKTDEVWYAIDSSCCLHTMIRSCETVENGYAQMYQLRAPVQQEFEDSEKELERSLKQVLAGQEDADIETLAQQIQAEEGVVAAAQRERSQANTTKRAWLEKRREFMRDLEAQAADLKRQMQELETEMGGMGVLSDLSSDQRYDFLVKKQKMRKLQLSLKDCEDIISNPSLLSGYSVDDLDQKAAEATAKETAANTKKRELEKHFEAKDTLSLLRQKLREVGKQLAEFIRMQSDAKKRLEGYMKRSSKVPMSPDPH